MPWVAIDSFLHRIRPVRDRSIGDTSARAPKYSFRLAVYKSSQNLANLPTADCIGSRRLDFPLQLQSGAANPKIASMKTPGLAAAAACAAFVLSGASSPAEEPVSRGAAFRQLAYMYGVAEYCGLITAEVFDGYQRESRFIRRRDGLTDPTARLLRLRGLTDADLEYGNRGLGGFRHWCRTEGQDAARHFLAFRQESLVDDGP
jgi:hypothetical protein